MKDEERAILWSCLEELPCRQPRKRTPTQQLSLQEKKTFIDNQIEVPYDKRKKIPPRAVNLLESDPVPHSRLSYAENKGI